MNEINLTIDRIILNDMGITPDRAEGIRAMVEVELQRLLEQEGIRDNLESGEFSQLSTPEMYITESQSDLNLAGSLAQRIAQAILGTI